jgi:cyclic pyranopterin phosphate synthase
MAATCSAPNEVLARTAGACRVSYLRAVVTTRCNHACPYCHKEGDPRRAGEAAELPFEDLARSLELLAGLGVRKFKLLGGEPLLRRDLPDVVRRLRAAAPEADLSVITAGVAPVAALDALYDAGLDRTNVSLHGFLPAEHAKRSRRPGAHAERARFLDAVLRRGRPVKLNYVYSGPEQDADLAALLAWAAPRGLLVNVLDDLSRGLGWRDVAEAVLRLRGWPRHVETDHDPDSLDTQRWRYGDGLRVEIKHEQLGTLAPFAACPTCPARSRCREGIIALRLTHDGHVRPCMDGPQPPLPLAALLAAEGPRAARARVQDWLAEV